MKFKSVRVLGETYGTIVLSKYRKSSDYERIYFFYYTILSSGKTRSCPVSQTAFLIGS
jgi:hypothetical protein